MSHSGDATPAVPQDPKKLTAWPKETRIHSKLNETSESLLAADSNPPNPIKIKDGRLQSEPEKSATLFEPEYRNFAGNVRRRTDRTIRAEPPPPNQPPANQAHQPIPSIRPGRPRQSLGDGSESDSDGDDNNRRAHGEDSSGNLTKQKPNPSPEEIWRPDTRALDGEEEERIQLMRKSREVRQFLLRREHLFSHVDVINERMERELKAFYRLRRAKLDDGLVGLNQNSPAWEHAYVANHHDYEGGDYDPVWLSATKALVMQLNSQRQIYLDQELFDDLKDNLDVGSQDNPYPVNYMEQLLEQVEGALLWRCIETGGRNSRMVWLRMSLQEKLLSVLVEQLGMSRQPASKYSPKAVSDWTNRTTYGDKSANSATRKLVDIYIKGVAETLSTKAYTGVWGRKPPNSNWDNQEPCYDLKLDSSAAHDWITHCRECFSASINPVDIQRSYSECIALQKYRHEMKGLNIEFKHEFSFVNGSVSLISTKRTSQGPFPISLKELSRNTMQSLGWSWDDIIGVYWTYEIRSFLEEPTREFVFMVDLNGALLGMFIGYGGLVTPPSEVDSRSLGLFPQREHNC